MERKKYLCLVIFVLLTQWLSANSRSFIYEAYVRNDMSKWKYTIEQYRPVSNNEKLELLNYLYGYIAYCIGNKKNDEAKKYLQQAQLLINDLEKNKYRMSELYAYKSAVIGFNIGLAPYKAPLLGKESQTFAEKSVAIDSTNYLGYIQLGNIAFYTPAVFGGSKKKAILYYLKALKLMEKNPENLKNNWNYLNLLATLINAYYEQEQYKLAEKYCQITLKVEPNFDWVKNHLYPKVLKKLYP